MSGNQSLSLCVSIKQPFDCFSRDVGTFCPGRFVQYSSSFPGVMFVRHPREFSICEKVLPLCIEDASETLFHECFKFSSNCIVYYICLRTTQQRTFHIGLDIHILFLIQIDGAFHILS